MNRKKIGVTLLVCAILASGLMAVGFVATNGIATDGTSDASGVDSGTSTQTLNVTVYADVQGQLVPIQGANVTIYEVTVVKNDTVETITIEKIAVSTTGVGGAAQIVLPEGDYTLVADYYGLRSVGILSNDTTDNISMVLNAGMGGHHGHYGGYADMTNSNRTAENMLVDTSAVTASGDATFTGRGMPRRH
jgi:hypothetical protein